MKKLTGDIAKDKEYLKSKLTSVDVLTFPFRSAYGTEFCLVFVDALTNKQILGDEVIRPLSALKVEATSETVSQNLLMAEMKRETETEKLIGEILSGNTVLLVDGLKEAIVSGCKFVTTRAVAEPPTDVALKGPREGFVEDVKINSSLVRRRIKSPNLKLELLTVGRQSQTCIFLCYLDGIAPQTLVEEVKNRISKFEIDVLPDASYLATALVEKPRSLLKQIGTTEKPDVFCGKIAEGRVGLLVDGTPIALTAPYLVVEDFQSPEDYFVPSYRASFTRFLRLFALIVAVFLPAFYVAAQIFKLQLFPIRLLLTIASSIQNIPLSPSLEILLVLLLLEVLNEASIRMPKYVGMALSVVGALVLGETAVNAGFVSTPAIIIIAFSGIGLYCVPNLIEVTSMIRLVVLVIAGSIGTFGILLATAFILLYLSTTENFGVPLFAPFAPFTPIDYGDSLVKYHLYSLTDRPRTFGSKNVRRLRHE